MSESRRVIDWEAIKERVRENGRAIENGATISPERLAKLREQRAQHLSSRAQVVEAASNHRSYLIFRSGSERFCLELNEISEVVPALSISKVPTSATSVSGIMNVRGEVKTIVDLGVLLALPDPRSASAGYVLILRKLDGELGLRVDEVEHVETFLPARDFAQQNISVKDGATQSCVEAVAAQNLSVLNCDQILNRCLKEGVA